MKKTLFTLTALLAGFAASADTLESWTIDQAGAVNTSGGSFAGFQFNLQGALDAGVATVTEEIASLPTTLTLDSVGVMVRSGNTATRGLYIVDSSNTVVAASAGTATATGGQYLTFDFGDVTISSSETYRVFLTSVAPTVAVGDTLTTNTGGVATQLADANAAVSGTGTLTMLNGFSSTQSPTYTPVVSISVSGTPAVPEPATATLSLLALAGLAARRRRK